MKNIYVLLCFNILINCSPIKCFTQSSGLGSSVIVVQSEIQAPLRMKLNPDNSPGEFEFGFAKEMISTRLYLEQKNGKAIVRILQQDNSGTWIQKEVLSFIQRTPVNSILDIKDVTAINSTMDSVLIKVMPSNNSIGMPDIFVVFNLRHSPLVLSHTLNFHMTFENSQVIDYIQPEFSFDEKVYSKIDTFWRTNSIYFSQNYVPNIFIKTIADEIIKQKAFSAKTIFYRFKVVYKDDTYQYFYSKPEPITQVESRYLNGKIYILKKAEQINPVKPLNSPPVAKNNSAIANSTIQAPIAPLPKDKVVASSTYNINSGEAFGNLNKSGVEVKIPERMASELATLKLNAESLMMSIYDNGTIDDDTITIFYNGKLLYDHYRLSELPLQFSLHFDEQHTKNEFLIVANNVGSIPPNTALMIIQVDNKRYEVFPKSDFKANALIKIEYTPRNQGEQIQSVLVPPALLRGPR